MKIGKIKILIACLIAGLILIAVQEFEHPTQVCDANFEEAMGKDSVEWHHLCAHKGSLERLEMLKAAFENNKPSKVKASSEPKIPKIIHHIWLGPKQVPSYFCQYKESWKKHHPDWELRFWTDKEVEALDFELKDLYMRTPNWGEKSDILRAELLERFGGIYADTDFECIKSFDELHYKYDFYAGIEPPHDGDSSSSSPHITISDALIGAAPGHPIIKRWKVMIREHWDEYERKYPDSNKRVLARTFYPFGRAVLAAMDDGERNNIVFPATYFFPLTFSELSKGRMKKMSYMKRKTREILAYCGIRKPTPFAEIQPETMAIHYWGHSWVKTYEERFRDMHKQIVEMQRDFKNEIDVMQTEIDTLKTLASK